MNLWSSPIARFLLKRLGLSLITLRAAEHDRVRGGPVAAGRRRADDPRVRSRTQGSVAALNHKLGTDQPVLTQYWNWISNFVQGDWGTSLRAQRPRSAGGDRRARELAEARARRVRDRGAAQHPGRRGRRPPLRQADRSDHLDGRPVAERGARVRVGRRPRPHLHDLARLAAAVVDRPPGVIACSRCTGTSSCRRSRSCSSCSATSRGSRAPGRSRRSMPTTRAPRTSRGSRARS